MLADALPPSLHFVEIKVFDWARSVLWYQEVLGLGLIQHDPKHEFALFAAGPARIGLKRGVAECFAERVRLVFEVADVEAAGERIRQHGMAVSPPRDNDVEGYREIRLTDPEGTPITLFQWLRSPGRL